MFIRLTIEKCITAQRIIKKLIILYYIKMDLIENKPMYFGKDKKNLNSKRKRKSSKINYKKSSKKQSNIPRYDLQQFTKKYTDRPSPPYPANKMCGKTRLGNDDNLYISKPNKNGICSWKRI